ncbi:hypothetical protein Nepgr_029817 [Nepenthes gracilis]|uniref:Myb-like domain-containing protein n=1 Tax=Nepenthes gracilis TaxID=150966 RepID=A0AAD3Y5G4_NEPGR|nr:hypothetical protein Nepgr_029817 [Nepenthes gracilis]
MDLFDDILSEPSAAPARVGGRFQPKVKPRHKKQSVFGIPSAVAEDALSDPALSVTPTEILGSADPMHSEAATSNGNVDCCSIFGKSMGEKTDLLGLESIDDLIAQSTIPPALCVLPEISVNQELASFKGDVTSNAVKDVQENCGRLETEEAKAFSCLEPLEIMSEVTATSGKTIGKYPQDSSMVHSEAQYRSEVGPVFAGSPHVIPDFPSLSYDDAFSTDSIAECLLNQVTEFEHGESWKRKTSTEPDSTWKYHDGGLVLTTDRANETSNSPRKLRKRKVDHESVVGLDNEAHDQDDSLEEAPDESVSVEDETNNGDYREQKKAPRKSDKKHPKKFSHSSRRKRRCVDKSLLEMPEDEIDFQKLPIRDLIIRAEFKERQANKETAAAKASTSDVRADRPCDDDPSYDDDETFDSDQGRGSFGNQPSSRVQIDTNYYNYQSYMQKSPIIRWSNCDTELFYQAISQFGSDLSMIQQLFPGRTRHQIKLKYKKEERRHPLRLHDALSTRPKDLSHMEQLMRKLQAQSAQQEKERRAQEDDSVGVTGEEEGLEESAMMSTAESLKETRGSEEKEEGFRADQEAVVVGDLPQSPLKSSESEDDLRWSQYKSDL